MFKMLFVIVTLMYCFKNRGTKKRVEKLEKEVFDLKVAKAVAEAR